MTAHAVTVGALAAGLLVSYTLLAVLIRHPHLITDLARDIAAAAAAAAAWPAKTARGLAYHHAGARHARPHTTTPALPVRTS